MSNNLNGARLVGGQANPETSSNDADGALDAALTETITVDLTVDETISAADYRACIRILVDPAGSSKTLTLRAIKRLVFIQNDGGNDIDIALGATTLTLADGSSTIVYTDGTADGLVEFSLGGGSVAGTDEPCDLALFVPGLPDTAAIVFRFNVLREFTWPVSLTGSVFNARVAATGTSVFTIKNNGSSIGTLSYAAAGTVPTVTFASPVTFAVNDLITIEAPAVQDATLADIAFNFLGSRIDGSTMKPFDMGIYVNGLPSAAAVVLRFNVVRDFVWQSGLTGSVFNSRVASTASKVFTIKNNGGSIGTLTFAISGTVPTVSFASDVFFVAGDVLTIEAPAVQDATLADIAFNFYGSR